MDFETNNKTTVQIIRAIMAMQGVSVSDLARQMHTSRQTLHSKFAKGDLSESEMKEIANILGYDVIITFQEK